MGWMMMNKFEKLLLSLSCFIPLYLIFGIKNGIEARAFYRIIDNSAFINCLKAQCAEFCFNAILCVIWIVLLAVSIVGILRFRTVFLKSQRRSKESIILLKADNITADYFFPYFSLFVVSFFTVDPTKFSDILILGFLVIFIILVYVRNDMYFINPILNIIGYRSFTIIYQRTSLSGSQTLEGTKTLETKVFATEYLNRKVGKQFFVSFSPHDFSVCTAIPDKE